MTTTLGDNQGYTVGPYTAYIQPVGAGAMQPPAYQDSACVTASFPDQTGFMWSWPANTAGVVSWLAIDFGDYDNTVPQTPIDRSQLQHINQLALGSAAQPFQILTSGVLDDFDIIIDMFLTSAPGSTSPQTHEIEVFLHAPAYSQAYVNSLLPIGTFTDANSVAWQCVINKGLTPHDILFMRVDRADVLSGSIDVRAMLLWLVTEKWCGSNEYFNGLAVGVEVQQGAGSAAIQSLSVTYG